VEEELRFKVLQDDLVVVMNFVTFLLVFETSKGFEEHRFRIFKGKLDLITRIIFIGHLLRRLQVAARVHVEELDLISVLNEFASSHRDDFLILSFLILQLPFQLEQFLLEELLLLLLARRHRRHSVRILVKAQEACLSAAVLGCFFFTVFADLSSIGFLAITTSLAVLLPLLELRILARSFAKGFLIILEGELVVLQGVVRQLWDNLEYIISLVSRETLGEVGRVHLQEDIPV